MNIHIIKLILFLIPKKDNIQLLFYSNNVDGGWSCGFPPISYKEVINKIKYFEQFSKIKKYVVCDNNGHIWDKIIIINIKNNYKNIEYIRLQIIKQKNIFLVFLKIFQLRFTFFIKNVLLLSNQL